MKTGKFFSYLIISLLHSLIFLIIPGYISLFFALLSIGLVICVAGIISDNIKKVSKWKYPFMIWRFAALSLAIGVVLVLIRNPDPSCLF